MANVERYNLHKQRLFGGLNKGVLEPKLLRTVVFEQLISLIPVSNLLHKYMKLLSPWPNSRHFVKYFTWSLIIVNPVR